MDFESFFKTIGKARRIAWIFGVLYILVCLGMGWEFDKINQKNWMVAAGTGGVVAFLWIAYPYFRRFCDYRQAQRAERLLGHEGRALGIRRIYTNGVPRKLLREQLTKPGIKRIRILAHSAKTYLILYAAELWPELLASRELTISLLIAHEGTPFIEEAAQMENIYMNREDPISPAIREVKQFLAGKAKKSNRKDFIEIRQYSTQIRANLVIVDDAWCCFTPHLPPVSPMNSFAFELEKVVWNDKKTLIGGCIDHFEAIWNIAEPVQDAT